MDKQEQTRIRAQRYRDKQKALRNDSVKPENVTLTTEDSVTLNVTQYPAVLHALADVDKRAKLRAICQSLGNKGLLKHVNYGVSGPPMDVVSEYLTALK